MGNFITSESLESESNKSNNINELNFIVSYYLYNMSWESLNDLLHKKYCEKLIKLITTIITKYYHVEHDSALSLAKLFVKILSSMVQYILNYYFPVVNHQNHKELSWLLVYI